MVLGDKLSQIGGTHVLFLLAQRIVQVQLVDAQLVGHDHVHVIGHTAGHPMVAADGLQPPDLIHVLEGDAVHLVGAVSLQQGTQTLHALAGVVDVGQHKVDDVLLADAALHQRVSAQHAGIGGNGLGSGHADVGGVDTGRRPDAFALHSVGHGGKAHGPGGHRDLHVRNHRLIGGGQVLRMDDRPLFSGEMPGTRIVVAGNHGRTVVGGIFADKNSSAGHFTKLPFLI